jgi:hypothetical protein
MKKKGKKKGPSFKVTLKTEDPDAQKAEMQMKKKILEDKLSKHILLIHLIYIYNIFSRTTCKSRRRS